MAVLCALVVTWSTPGLAQRRGIAYLELSIPSQRTIASERPDVLDRAVLPGSVAKIATLAAALESGAATDKTTVTCTRQIVVAGHRVTCTHPDLGRPLNATEALAHSCNVYFATVASRLPRTAFESALRSLGLPAADPAVPLAAEALGLDGLRATPRQLASMITRIAANPETLGWRPQTVATIRNGLTMAAKTGTAAALGAHGIDAMAKTGTVVDNGLSQGLVVGVTPASSPNRAFVLLVAGGAGVDAVDLAADRLAPASTATVAPSIRIGVARANGSYDIRTLPLDDYVAGVVAGEAAPGMAPAALEALAVTVRTYALANLNRHRGDGFDLCDLTHCQVLKPSTRESVRASAATAGRLLLDGGKPASVYYTASCGAHSARPSQVWKGASDPPFLPSRNDDACGGGPEWAQELPAGQIEKALRAGGFRGDALRDLRVAQRSESGRVAWLSIPGMTPPEISGEDFRTLVGRSAGWQYVRSTLFEVTRTGTGYRFNGHGAGHGVGLCVLGASRRATAGADAAGILAFYFPGLRIGAPGAQGDSSAGAIRVTVPPSEERNLAAVRQTVEKQLSEVASALGMVPPANITVRFHPTVESYQRATGRSWTTVAAVHGLDVQLVPLTVLRQREALESTLRHEFVHVLTTPSLEGRPLWVAEGLATYYSGEFEGTTRSTTCPSDTEMTRASSAEALHAAYQRAAACVDRAIKAGQSWRDVGR